MGDNHRVQISFNLPDGSPSTPTSHDEAGGSDHDDPGGNSDANRALPVVVALDEVCAAAVTRARQAALEVAGAGHVGEHAGVVAEGQRLVSHHFECLTSGYHGWRWSVVLARAPRSRTPTVCEVVLLPGPEAVLAPQWLPWSDRVAPGDLGATDQLAYRDDDPYLEPGYAVTDELDEDRTALWELGLGRERVMSRLGLTELARRWYSSDRGPTSDEAVHAQAACSTCGYFLPLAGSLRTMFGACGNEWSPSDGRVVSADHGCGAHSETDVDRPVAEALPALILDETGAEAIVLPPRPAEPEGPASGTDPDVEEAVAEDEGVAPPEADT